MALKPCRECGQQVSTSAETCPHCGVHSPAAADPLSVLNQTGDKKRAPIGTVGGFRLDRVAMVLVVIFVIGWIINGGSGDKSNTPSTNSVVTGTPEPATKAPHKEASSSWTSISKFRDKDGFVTIVDPTHKTAVIFKSSADAMKASDYSKANPNLKVIDVIELVACIVDNGTRAIVDGSDYPAFKITIAEGKSRGCQGVVLTAQLRLAE